MGRMWFFVFKYFIVYKYGGGGVWRSIREMFLIFGEILRAYKHHTETK